MKRRIIINIARQLIRMSHNYLIHFSTSQVVESWISTISQSQYPTAPKALQLRQVYKPPHSPVPLVPRWPMCYIALPALQHSQESIGRVTTEDTEGRSMTFARKSGFARLPAVAKSFKGQMLGSNINDGVTQNCSNTRWRRMTGKAIGKTYGTCSYQTLLYISFHI